MEIIINKNWQPFDNGNSINQKGSENGNIIYDIEHINGARISIEKETSIAPYATTLGVYGVMFHTKFDGSEAAAKQFVFRSIQKIEKLLNLLSIPGEKQDKEWKDSFNTLVEEIAEV